MLDEAQKRARPAGVWFNSRPKTNLHIEKKFLRHVEIEALPTGGWGYAYFPYVARFVRPLGLPTLSHTGRFHKSWGDNGGLKPRGGAEVRVLPDPEPGHGLRRGRPAAPARRAQQGGL